MNLSGSELFLPLDRTEQLQDAPSPPISFWKDVWQRFHSNRIAFVSLCIFLFLVVMALIGPTLCGYTYYETHLELSNQPPSWRFWFGTDDLGRDVFTRVWFGARISLFIGFVSAFIDLVIGVIWGAVAAYVGGKVDEMLMRFADTLYSLPYLLVVILVMVVIGSGMIPIIVAMTLIGWIGMARLTRAQILQLKELEYVQSARALGASNFRILFRHLIPNAMGPIIAMTTMTIATAIFTEAFLSFLGLGVQAPIASWGTMANEALPAMRYYPWRLFFPAFFVSITLLTFHLLGDAFRSALDPRLKHSK
jgi:oligopeptide transport system permease protein